MIGEEDYVDTYDDNSYDFSIVDPNVFRQSLVKYLEEKE